MKKEPVTLEDIHLIGLTVRTNNKDEMNPDSSKISKIANVYWENQVAQQFEGRVNPGVTYAVYTNYESDESGEYTFFIGEAIQNVNGADQDDFERLTIPAGRYQKFTTSEGVMPNIVIESWQEIWQMTLDDFGGERTYITDFEIYDQRARDPMNASIDIYIGIK